MGRRAGLGGGYLRDTAACAGVRLLLTADTHVPARARDLPESLWRAIDVADVVVHAGDWVEVGLLEAISASGVRSDSHIPWDSVTPGGMRLLNPGSPTDRRRQPMATYLTAEIHDGSLGAVVLHPIHPPSGGR